MDLALLTRTYELAPEKEFFSIPVSSIGLNTISNFDLYLNVRPDEPLVLYSREGCAFDQELIETIHKVEVPQLYVPSEQVEQYRNYIENNLSEFLAEHDASMEQKAEMLYACASHVMKTILEMPSDEKSIKRGKDIVNHSVRFMTLNRDTIQIILNSAPAEFSIFAHTINGCFMAIALAQQLGIGHPIQLRRIGLGVMLRDIGMTMIDMDVIEKRGRLNIDEFRQVKQHPLFGEKMVRNLSVVSDIECDIIRMHHERLNGSGYPHGTLGKDIPAHVRMVAVVDVFCRLTADRPQQPRMSSFEALQFMTTKMNKELDTKFIPALVHVLCLAK